MCEFLGSIGLQPIQWSEAVRKTHKTNPYIGEILDAGFSMAQAIVVLMTPDDEGRLLPEFKKSSDPDYETKLFPQARLNVIYEAGMAVGRNQKRTILVQIGKLRPFTDIDGKYILRLDNSFEKRKQLIDSLKTAGCEVNDSTNWLSIGDFDIHCTTNINGNVNKE